MKHYNLIHDLLNINQRPSVDHSFVGHNWLMDLVPALQSNNITIHRTAWQYLFMQPVILNNR